MSFVLEHMNSNLWRGRFTHFPSDVLEHGISARLGGVSVAPYSALNMGLHVGVISAESKPKYHAASVFASNFVCGIYGTAVRLLTECGFSEESASLALRGLFLGNAAGVGEKGPVGQLTGPTERCDTKTIRTHLEVLSPGDAELYKMLTSETLALAKFADISL